MKEGREQAGKYQKGQGAQISPHNRFVKDRYDLGEADPDFDNADDLGSVKTKFIPTEAKTIVNEVSSEDTHMDYSVNPYQGCEHGCIYCYARNSHEYWGYSAGIDFERNILVKHNAPERFKAFLQKKSWVPRPITLSGNTDCYQPAERKFKLTRQLLQIALDYRQPVRMITKNSLILRDLDILRDLASENLIEVFVSLNSLEESLRQKLEPRTTTATQRLKIMENLSLAGVPVGVMQAPIIPGLNDQETPQILKAVANAGAKWAGYTVVRLNGQIGDIFKDWLFKTFADRADKIWHAVEDCHGGQVNDTEFGRRMKGDGHLAKLIKQTFELHAKINQLNVDTPQLDTTKFRRPGEGKQLSLF